MGRNYFMIFVLYLYWKCIENSIIFVLFLNTCLYKEWNRSVSTNRLSFCAPLKVPRPILRKTWLGLEDKHIFQLKYQCVFLWCFCQFFTNNFKKRPKHQRQTHRYFSWKNSYVFQGQPRFPEYGSRNFWWCAGGTFPAIYYSVSLIFSRVFRREILFFSVNFSIFRGWLAELRWVLDLGDVHASICIDM